jgi:outer membrane protein, heavy metal efflux system
MLGIPLLRGRSSACPLRTGGATIGFAFIFAAPGCATTAGSTSYDNAQIEYHRSAQHGSRPKGNDPAAGLEANVLDRNAYVRAVLERNPTVESARQGWRAALSRVKQSGAFEDPMVDFGFAPLSIGSQARFGYEVGISQRLPWFGKRGFQAAAAEAEASASKSDYESMKRDLALSAVVLYDQYFIAVRSIEINAHHIELVHAIRDAAAAQYRTGRASVQDPLQAETQLAHLEHDAATLASQRDVTVAQMNELLHRAPGLPLPPPPAELVMPTIPGAGEAEHLQSDAIAHRTEITAARQRAEGARARAAGADREHYPDVTVSTSYSSMWDMPEHRWMVGLGLSLPIQTGRRSAAGDEAVAMQAQFESDASRLTDAARTQVFVALKKIEESERVIGIFEKRLVPLARAQLDASRVGFTSSQNPFMAVMEAENNLRTVELDYQMARAECDRRTAELERALGRIPGLDAQEDKP